MDTHLSAATGLWPAGADYHSYQASGVASSAAGGALTPGILGTAGTPNPLEELGLGSSSSGGSGSSLVNALQGLAQLLGGGNGGGASAGSGFTLSLPQYQPMAKANQSDTSDLAPSPPAGGNADE